MNERAIQKLNLGSGALKKDGFINVDWQAATEPDIVHDLNVFPYPFPDGRFEYIEAVHVLEHLDRPFAVMKELHRILKPGGGSSSKSPILAAVLRTRSIPTVLMLPSRCILMKNSQNLDFTESHFL